MCVASYFKTGMVFSCLLVLVGCGGGNGTTKNSASSNSSSSQSSSSSSVKMNQTLDFELDGEVIILVGEAENNKARGQGVGGIYYESDNPDVVTTDGTGRVFAKNQPGTARITATISADDNYASATASYNVKVIPETIPVSIWIGEDDALIDFPSTAIGFEFYRTTEADCDINLISSCDQGQMDVVNQSRMEDSAVTADQSGFYTLKQGKYKGDLAVSHLSGESMGRAPIPADSTLDVVVHDGKLWLSASIDDWDANIGIWTSTDGMTWNRENLGGASRLMYRFNHEIYSFKDKIWMIGGDTHHNTYNSIYSLDLIDPLHPTWFIWSSTEQDNDFAWRIGHQVVSFNDKLFVIAGAGESFSVSNSIWSSTDGNEWIEESASAAFSARMYHQVVSFNNKLWLIGGRDTGYKNDVWSSVDGVTWVLEKAAAEFPARERHQVVVFNDKLWLIGGSTLVRNGEGEAISAFYNDVWSSSDGVTWTLEQESAAFSPREFHKVVSFNNQLLLVGGNDGEDQNDIWVSADGINWRKGFSGTFELTDTSTVNNQ